jgi:hypothetical protein
MCGTWQVTVRTLLIHPSRHCEKRSDEAIHTRARILTQLWIAAVASLPRNDGSVNGNHDRRVGPRSFMTIKT